LWVYSSPQQSTLLTQEQIRDAGALLPGFQLELEKLFAKPGEAGQS
jgi:hypothetical protein